MPQPESEHKGELPLVVASELVEGEWALVKLQLPVSFDFQKDGGKLLRNIKSAVHLFFRPTDEEESG
jgi:hypothetical protein